MEQSTSAVFPFIQLARSWRFGLFLFLKLPSAWFSGVRLRSIDPGQCEVTVPYRWFSRNPFGSTYFACLAMAAELSTGALAMVQVYGRKPAVSMLVTGLRAEYYKKATGVTRFNCSHGDALASTIREAIASGEGRTIEVRSDGIGPGGQPVASFFITWSFKTKTATSSK